MTACSDNSKSSESSTKYSTSSEKVSPLSKAKTDVDSLFDDSDHTELLGGTTLGSIKSVSTEVNKLPSSKAKDELTKDITTAKKLWPEFAKETSQKDASSSSKESQKLATQESKDAVSKSKADAESKAKAQSSSTLASSKAESKKKLQQFTKSNSVSLVKKMHARIDDSDGISAKVSRLSKSPGKNIRAIRKEMIVLKNVATECDNNYIDADNYPGSDSDYADKVNSFWDLSATILRMQRNYLGYLIGDKDSQPSSSELSDNVDQWNSIYHEIVK
ncbi:toxin Cry1Ac domain D-VI-related protein [Lactiplantibacillus modestisalitolerans]|uniref:Toxin Cry1Ac domain D-VI-related protein n=1 Tax=Lactiplantibacillus modestisalitolerans TaxID=1457219 RepID=A0ABV5WTT5_9LACO|nr:toxin Cry1Ac domain D-VI-related protein [Lactiplantibacillus modestisalitolerans]